METVSENTGERKRGRPKALSDLEMATARGIPNGKCTNRHLQNVAYCMRALRELTHDPRFAWLCNEKAMRRGERHSWCPTILTELGRIEDPETMKVAALRICELKPRTHDAVTMIRRWRLNKAKQVNVLQLTKELANTMDNYRLRHPSITWKQVRGALVNAMDVVEALIDETEHESEKLTAQCN